MSVQAAEVKQNLTLRLNRSTIHKAKILAAKKATSVSALLSEELDRLVSEDDAYEQARIRSLARMKQGFHLGGDHHWDRDSLHDRKALRES